MDLLDHNLKINWGASVYHEVLFCLFLSHSFSCCDSLLLRQIDKRESEIWARDQRIQTLNSKFKKVLILSVDIYLLPVCQEFWGPFNFVYPSITWVLVEGSLLPPTVEMHGGWMFPLSATWQPACGCVNYAPAKDCVWRWWPRAAGVAHD